MENKFYTPSIEEFGIGFEYEITNGYEWINKIFSNKNLKSFLYEQLENALDQKQIRVKYLDSTDIESLGFEIEDLVYYDSNDAGNFVNKETLKEIYAKHIKSHMGGNYGLNDEYLCIRTNRYRPQYFELIKVQYYGDGSASLRTKFQGNIKNKSELKKLLKMLEIK